MTTASKTETLHSAMASAFGELEAATKSANNPHFKSKYADIGAVIDAIKPALIKHGLFFTQHPQPSEEGVTVETFLHHASGESLSLGSLYVPANKRDAQGFGSALTYARRYALVTAFGVPTEDDDGNAARNGGGHSNDARSAAPTPEPPARTNFGGLYPTKTAMREARIAHHEELLRIGQQGTFDDLDDYLTREDYKAYIATATTHFPNWLEGALPEGAPPEYVQTFTLESKARDMIAIRGNTRIHDEELANEQR